MNVDLPALFGLGVVTVATPCILPLLPIWLGMLLGSSIEAVRERGGARLRLVAATASFAAGFALVFSLLGLGASAAGAFLQAHRDVLTVAGGGLIVLFGLKFLGALRLPALERELRLPHLRTGRRLLDAALFGVVFALGWTPCVGPMLGSVLTYTASRAADPWAGALYLATYSLGVASPLLLAALFADRLLPLLGRLNQRLPLIEKATGAALVLIGLGLVAAVVPGWVAAARDDRVAALDPPVGEPSDRPRLVEFYAPGCPACELAAPRVEELRQDCAGRRLEIVQLSTADRRTRELARRYRVAVVPTFVLVGASGEEEGRLVGAPELDGLRSAAASLLAAPCAGVVAEGEGTEGEGTEPRPASTGCPGAAVVAGDRPAAATPLDSAAEPLPFEDLAEPACEG